MIYPAESQLNGAITATATSLTLTSAAGFTAAPFHLVVEGEIILCPTLPTGNAVAGVTRGTLGTVAAAHADQVGAYGLFSKAFQRSAMAGLGGWWDQLAAQLEVLQASPLSPGNAGSNFVWNGYPLTGVSFASSFVTVAGGGNQTVYTNPSNSGKRVLIEAWFTNVSGAATTYTEWKSNGTLLIGLNNNLAVAIGANGSASYPAFLEPGESFVLSCPGSLLFTIGAMSFDVTNPLKTVTVYGGQPAGTTVLYTCPANTTAFPVRNNLVQTPAFDLTSPFVGVTNNDSLTITYTLSVAGNALNTPAAVGATAFIAIGLNPVLTAGQQVSMNASATANGNTCYYFPIWERPN